MSLSRAMAFSVLGWTLVAVLGCSRSSGPPRFALSGSVTQGGRLVPAGYITLAPDTAQGNSGPGAQADIRDGRYELPADQGTIGGPHVATVYGFDGRPLDLGGGRQNPLGAPLFSGFRVEVDLPKQTATQDFAVPAASR